MKSVSARMWTVLGGSAAAALLTAGTAVALAPDDTAEARFDERATAVVDALVDAGVLEEAERDTAEQALRDFAEDQRAAAHDRFTERQAEREALLAELGVTPEELREAMRDRTPLGELVDDLKTARERLIEAGTERWEEALEAGAIDQETFDEEVAEVPERVDALLAGERPEGGPGLGRGGPHRGHPGGHGPGHHGWGLEEESDAAAKADTEPDSSTAEETSWLVNF
jgi:hypothetical protein